MAKKVLMIIAFEGFRDEEYQQPKTVLEKAGVEVTTASSKLGTATGKLGMKAKVDITLDQVKVSGYDAVLFIGGPGCYNYYDDPTCHKIAQETVKEGKILGAICAAPGILAQAGVLKGKKATMFADDGTLAKGGAIYTGKGVEIDGKIITATGPSTAKAFGEAILKALP
ncbi:MAG: DJ-1/PfpI family protein [Candidatus Margulisiibacteriota bacterium]